MADKIDIDEAKRWLQKATTIDWTGIVTEVFEDESVVITADLVAFIEAYDQAPSPHARGPETRAELQELLQRACRGGNEALALAKTYSDQLDAAMALAREMDGMKVGERLTDAQFAALQTFTALVAGTAGGSQTSDLKAQT